MQIFDVHIHHRGDTPDPAGILKKMEEAGVYGGCVFSNRPTRFDPIIGSSFEERMEQVKAYAEGGDGRLFPVLWIHPYEENIMEHLHRAVEGGVVAFKMICGDFYVYEEECLAVLREIAKLGKPVFFHSGILWDGKVSSQYNRPLNWEALLEIEGLRFSMGHCSWPWIDECIAMYGKFLNAGNKKNIAEMFFDITPGTPEIYREELLTKLYTIGYNIGDNIFFGTDATADKYSSDWAAKWLKIDGKILDKLGVSECYREKLYRGNLMRFLGKEGTAVKIAGPVPDDSRPWSAVNPEVEQIIESWYKKLNFPKEYDKEFYQALREIKISDAIDIETYEDTGDGKRNLLSYLYFCHKLEKKYAEKGIPEQILLDTAQDIVVWTKTWSDVKGELYLGETGWLKLHMSGRLFRLGRLQFCMETAGHDIPEKGIAAGEKTIGMHIPAIGPMKPEACEESLRRAREFFPKYFPEHAYRCFTCHSWLLDSKLEELLPYESNILAFQRLFERISEDDSYALLRYIFRWNTSLRNLKDAVCYSSLSEKVKRAALKGEQFHESLGVIEK